MRVLVGFNIYLHNVKRAKTLMSVLQRLGANAAHHIAAANIVVTSSKRNLPPLHYRPVVHTKWLVDCWKTKKRLDTDEYSFSKTFNDYAHRCGWTCNGKGIFTKGTRVTTDYNEVAQDLQACTQGAANVLQRTIRGHQARQHLPTLRVAITGVPRLAPFCTHPRATVALMLTYLYAFHDVPNDAQLLYNGTPLPPATRLQHVGNAPLVLHCQHAA